MRRFQRDYMPFNLWPFIRDNFIWYTRTNGNNFLFAVSEKSASETDRSKFLGFCSRVHISGWFQLDPCCAAPEWMMPENATDSMPWQHRIIQKCCDSASAQNQNFSLLRWLWMAWNAGNRNFDFAPMQNGNAFGRRWCLFVYRPLFAGPFRLRKLGGNLVTLVER